jgi:hypothetical protein
MMRLRLSVRALCVVIALVAADCAMLRAAFAGYKRVVWVNVIAVPMMNILVLTFYRQQILRWRGESRPRLTGFQLAGWAGVAAALALFIGVPESFVALVKALDPVREIWFHTPTYLAAAPNSPTWIRTWWLAELSLLFTLSTALTAALLTFASVGGWLAARFFPAPKG